MEQVHGVLFVCDRNQTKLKRGRYLRSPPAAGLCVFVCVWGGGICVCMCVYVCACVCTYVCAYFCSCSRNLPSVKRKSIIGLLTSKPNAPKVPKLIVRFLLLLCLCVCQFLGKSNEIDTEVGGKIERHSNHKNLTVTTDRHYHQTLHRL